MTQPTRRLLVRLAFAAEAIIVVVTLFIGRSSSAIAYFVVDLATLEQGSTAVVHGPNAAGNAVGGGRVAGARRGLLFTRGGVQEIRGLSRSDYTTVFGINDVGDVDDLQVFLTSEKTSRHLKTDRRLAFEPKLAAVIRDEENVGGGDNGERANHDRKAVPAGPNLQPACSTMRPALRNGSMKASDRIKYTSCR